MIKNKVFYSFVSAIFFLTLVAISTPEKSFAEVQGDVDPEIQTQTCIDLKNNLRRGSRDTLTNGEVSFLQSFLQDREYLNQEPTGFFGLLTQNGVKSFQSESGFSPTGFVGPLTRAKIKELSCSGASFTLPSSPVAPARVSFDQSPVTVTTGTSISSRGGTLTFSGTVSSKSGTGGNGVSAWFEVGPSESSLGSNTESTRVSLGPITGNDVREFSVDMNLQSGTKYYFRAVALTKVGDDARYARGKTYSFTTPGVSSTCPIVPYVNCGYGSSPVSGGADANGCKLPNRCVFSNQTPTENPPLLVTSPNGGERWEIGALNTITWAPYDPNTGINTANQVTAYLEKKVGGEFVALGRILDQGKASLHTYFNLDSYNKFAEPGEYYVSVINPMTGRNDRSDFPFTLLPRSVDLKVNGSDGPITLAYNQKINVSWSGTEVKYCALYNVQRSIGGTEGNIASLATSGTLELYFAPLSGTSNNVWISCERSDGATRGDVVNVGVSGGAPTQSSLKILKPNGGEILRIGESYPITWNQIGLRNASVALYKNDQWMKWLAPDLPQTANPDSQGYNWIPSGVEAEASPLGNVFKIYITGTKADGTGYVDDKSDAPFGFVSTTPTGNTGALNISVGVTPSASTITPGDAGLNFGTYQLDATQSSESLRISPISLYLTLGNQARAQDLTTCYLFDGPMALNTGPKVVNPQSGGLVQFNFDQMLYVVKMTTKTLTLRCNLSAGASAGATYSWGLSGQSIANVVGVSAGNDVSETVTVSSGPTMTVRAVVGTQQAITPSINSFTASPTQVSSGQPTTLSWGSSLSTSCLIFRDNNNLVASGLGASGSYTVYPTVGTTYTLSCLGTADGSGKDAPSAQSNVFVSIYQTYVPPTYSTPSATIDTFYAEPATISSGGTSRLTWWSSNTLGSCTMNSTASNIGTVLPTGTLNIGPLTSSNTYTLTCYGNAGSPAIKSVTVTVNPAVATPELHVIGVYQGTSPRDFCYSTISSTSVRVRNIGKPIILALSSYEPMRWNISLDSGATVSKIILGGYNRQDINDVPIPVTNQYTYFTGLATQGVNTGYNAFHDARNLSNGKIYKDPSSCPESAAIPMNQRIYLNGGGENYYAYQIGGSAYDSWVNKLRAITGLSPTSFQGIYTTPTSGFIVPAQTSAVIPSSTQIASVISVFGEESPAQIISVGSVTEVFNHNFTEDLYRGISGGEVKALQQALAKENLFSGEISGNFYDQTLEAVKNFQSKYGINPTGYVGPSTRAKLNELYNR